MARSQNKPRKPKTQPQQQPQQQPQSSEVDSATDGLDIGSDSIEFDGELKYYANERNLTGQQRVAVEAWEKKRSTAKIEYGTSIKQDGTSYGERRGGKGSVSTPIFWHMDDYATFSHIHPRENGVLGGTFSDGDIYGWCKTRSRIMRAVAKEGTYSISKKKGFDAQGMRAYTAKVNNTCDSAMRRAAKDFQTDLSSMLSQGKSYQSAWNACMADYNRKVNNALIQLHNDYKAGEKQYNYYYTLEKRS